MKSEQRKPTVLWAVPRSASTAFFRAMLSHSEIGVLLEPFAHPYYFGPQRVSQRYRAHDSDLENTFLNAKRKLEDSARSDNARLLFVKDMAYFLFGNKHRPEDLLPSGFRHTFFMRHPHKTVSSLYRLTKNTELDGWDTFNEAEVGFKELWSLYELIRAKEGAAPLVLEADDLLRKPEEYMRLYCDHIGLKFEPQMLQWGDSGNKSKFLEATDGWPAAWFGSLLNATSLELPPDSNAGQELPKDIAEAIERCMPFYEKLRNVKTVLD